MSVLRHFPVVFALASQVLLCASDASITTEDSASPDRKLLSFSSVMSVPGMINDGVDSLNEGACYQEERAVNATCERQAYIEKQRYEAKMAEQVKLGCMNLKSSLNQSADMKIGDCTVSMGMGAWLTVACERDNDNLIDVETMEREVNRTRLECISYWTKKIDCEHHMIPNPSLAYDIHLYFSQNFNFVSTLGGEFNKRVSYGTDKVTEWSKSFNDAKDSVGGAVEGSATLNFIIHMACKGAWSRIDDNLQRKLYAQKGAKIKAACGSIMAKFKSESGASLETENVDVEVKAGMSAFLEMNCTGNVQDVLLKEIEKEEAEYDANCSAYVLAELKKSKGNLDSSFIQESASRFEAKVHSKVESTLEVTSGMKMELIANQSYSEFTAEMKDVQVQGSSTQDKFAVDVPANLNASLHRSRLALGLVGVAGVTVAAVLVGVARRVSAHAGGSEVALLDCGEVE